MRADNSADTDVPEQDQPGPADKLRTAREAADLSVDEVAHQLHLSREAVLALESGEFDLLGAPVFVKGHLRSYARLMELDEREIVAGYQPSEPEPEEFRTLSMHSEVKPAASLSNFVLLVALGVIVLVAAVYLLLGDNESGEESDFEQAAISEPDANAEISAELLEPPVVAPVDSAVSREDFAAPPTIATPPTDNSAEISAESFTESDAEVIEISPQSDDLSLSVAETLSEQTSQPPVAVPAESEAVSVTFRFAEECWVEVSDAKRRLMYGLKKPGHESSFKGVPPFKIFLGNSPAVELEVAGKAYQIPLSGRRGKTARFTIAEEDLQ
jgi:cytoskeleton protein RodZ